ncbi:hypothetical protein [Cetobacterium sp. ZWU0022]|uniref:hypothetical protein n=1 Tax=Cetobacterium sp. ZWU0022 TaxID=1340502 RepID=UPI0006461A31|nr:hypothetical protein [Cetobacterium sp. ZWU0022]
MLKNFFSIFKKNKEKQFSEEINSEINIETHEFKVVGAKDDFVISFHNNQIEFITKKGVIIGFKDKSKSNQIFYYEKEGI